MKKENKDILHDLISGSGGLLRGIFAECTRCKRLAPIHPEKDNRKTFVCLDCTWKEQNPQGIEIEYQDGTTVKVDNVSFGSIRTPSKKSKRGGKK